MQYIDYFYLQNREEHIRKEEWIIAQYYLITDIKFLTLIFVQSIFNKFQI